jgi:hypothetical protein
MGKHCLQDFSRLGYRNSLSLLRTCFHASFLLGIFFDPEDEGDMFLRNVGMLSVEYSSLYSRRKK